MATFGVFAYILDERGRALCVRHNYGERWWALPGGGVDAGEDPLEALVREVLEEAALVVEIGAFVGAYSAPYKDDLVLFFEARVRERRVWQANGEIAEIGFFSPDQLPEPMMPNARLRIADAAAGRRGLFRVLSSPGVAAGG